MEESEAESRGLLEQCQNWFSLNRKARREHSWASLLRRVFALLMPEIALSELLITRQDLEEDFHLLMSAYVSMHKAQQHTQVRQSPVVDLIIPLGGVIGLCDAQGHWIHYRAGQTVEPQSQKEMSRSSRVELVAIENTSYLKGERKTIEKFKNDILRHDRQIKDKFLSNHLFCGLTPVMEANSLSVMRVKENQTITAKSHSIYLLQQGLVKRSQRDGRQGGSELTAGCILSFKVIAGLIEEPQLFEGSEVYQSKANCTILVLQAEEMARILKLNPGLKEMLEQKLKMVWGERESLRVKSSELRWNFNHRFSNSSEAIMVHYPIEFKNRNLKSAGSQRSFRRKKTYGSQELNCSEFISCEPFNKMMESKVRVRETKEHYRSLEKARCRPQVVKVDVKKMKLQKREMKIQTGKISKMTQRESKGPLPNEALQCIKQSIMDVSNYFSSDTPRQVEEVPDIPRTIFDSSLKRQSRRTSTVRTDDYLKAECFSEQKGKATTRSSFFEESKENRQNQQCLTVRGRAQPQLVKRSRHYKRTVR